MVNRFPDYSYVPGLFPHPIRDRQGHSFQKEWPPVRPITSETWMQNDVYLHAIELFNRGYYWEAHEAWEQLWLACGRQGGAADFLKALIHLAAAGVKCKERLANGVLRHAQKAGKLFEKVQPQLPPTCFGLNLQKLLALADQLKSTTPICEPHEQRVLQPLLGHLQLHLQ